MHKWAQRLTPKIEAKLPKSTIMESIAHEDEDFTGVSVKPEESESRGLAEYVLECRNAHIVIGKKPILHGINGAFIPGQLTALMGPSGSGKTTLMNAMSGRGAVKVSTGEILMNGGRMTRARVRKISALVPQLDVLFAVLTCRETLDYTARLALKSSKKERAARVDQVVRDLSLEGCLDVLVGNEDIKGLSGGERKRVSIGMELLTNPSIMFLDEPTSGLDSKIAKDVVELLQKLAEAGRTVICTIHQPSFQVFSCFDQLLLLNKGRVAYSGRVDSVADYFTDIGHPVGQFTNPADHMLEVLGQGLEDPTQSFAEMFNASSFREAFDEFAVEASRIAGTLAERNGSSNEGTRRESRLAWWYQFQVLFRRSAYITIKDRHQFLQRLVQVVLISIVVGLLFFDLPNTQSTRFDRQSILFIVVLFNTMSTLMGTVVTLPIEKAMIKREYGNGYFFMSSFYISRTLVLYMFQTLFTVVLVIMLYPMVNFVPEMENVLVFLGTLLLLGNLAISLGYLFGTLFPNITTAIATIPSIIIPLVFFSGLFIAPENIPVYFVWMYYLSFLQYAFTLLVVNEFKDRQFEPCTLAQLTTPGACPLGSCSPDPFNFTVPAERCSGLLVINQLGYSVDDQAVNAGILFAFWIAVVILGAIVLRRFLERG